MTSETTAPALSRDALTTETPVPERPRSARTAADRGGRPTGAPLSRLPVPPERLALAGLLVATALLYLWGLGASGWANSFYSAAAQAGSESWKAFFFGSSDAANSITVDKTPLALWPMGLSVRVFGLSSWSILVPQALEGVAAVGLLYATVRRTTGSAGAGLLAGATMALTPVAVLMFRFNNPDAMLVLLLVASAYATLRAVEASVSAAAGASGRAARWLALAGMLVGLAFLAKMLQSFLVIPALVAVYALYAGVTWRRKLLHLLGAAAGMVLAAGWWIAIVSVWPAASRPYIGGSQHNSILELTLGYNGFGRLNGSETGSVGGGNTTGGQWGATGPVPDVRLRGRHPGRLADPGRPDPRCGGPVVRPRPGRAGRALGPDPLARLAARHRPHLQLHGRDLPRLLHRGPGARDRRPRRDRLPGAVAAPRLAGRHRAAGTHHRPHRRRCRSSSSPATRRGSRGCGGPCSSSASPVPP